MSSVDAALSPLLVHAVVQLLANEVGWYAVVALGALGGTLLADARNGV